jgi:hypothetical protein
MQGTGRAGASAHATWTTLLSGCRRASRCRGATAGGRPGRALRVRANLKVTGSLARCQRPAHSMSPLDPGHACDRRGRRGPGPGPAAAARPAGVRATAAAAAAAARSRCPSRTLRLPLTVTREPHWQWRVASPVPASDSGPLGPAGGTVAVCHAACSAGVGPGPGPPAT